MQILDILLRVFILTTSKKYVGLFKVNYIYLLLFKILLDLFVIF